MLAAASLPRPFTGWAQPVATVYLRRGLHVCLCAPVRLVRGHLLLEFARSSLNTAPMKHTGTAASVNAASLQTAGPHQPIPLSLSSSLSVLDSAANVRADGFYAPVNPQRPGPSAEERDDCFRFLQAEMTSASCLPPPPPPIWLLGDPSR